MTELMRNWWMVGVRGLLAMLFGLTVLSWSDPSLLTIVVLFGAYAMLDGLWAVASVVRASPRGPRRGGWLVAAEGVASLGIGALALTWPFVSRETVLLIAGWGIATGVLELATALCLADLTGRWLLGTAGGFSIFLGGLILMLPHADAARVASLLGVYALGFGLVVTLAAIAFRRRHGALPPSAAGASLARG